MMSNETDKPLAREWPVQAFDPKRPERGWYTPAPEPFWAFNWRVLRPAPSCYECRKKFRNLLQWEIHWFDVHIGKRPSTTQENTTVDWVGILIDYSMWLAFVIAIAGGIWTWLMRHP